jgi:hypothetical protein
MIVADVERELDDAPPELWSMSGWSGSTVTPDRMSEGAKRFMAGGRLARPPAHAARPAPDQLARAVQPILTPVAASLASGIAGGLLRVGVARTEAEWLGRARCGARGTHDCGRAPHRGRAVAVKLRRSERWRGPWRLAAASHDTAAAWLFVTTALVLLA